MNQDITDKKAVVLVRGNPDDHNPDPIQHFINQHQIEVIGEWFYDWRSGSGNWAFGRYENRLAFSKGVERGVNCIIVEPNFFFSIGQTSRFEQRLMMQMMDKLNMPLVSITGTFDSLSCQHSTPDDDQLFEVVVGYEKLRNQLSKLRRKTQNQQKGIVDLKGRGKVGGRKSVLETKPELIKHVKELKSGDYTNQEISNILFKMGYTNSKGKAYHRAQITDFFRQSKKLE